MTRHRAALGFFVLLAVFTACDRRALQSSLEPRRTPLVTESFTVGARDYRYWEFDASTDTEISGRFEAEGGSGNDIECLLFDKDHFTNWANGHNTATYYNSGRVTVGTVKANVPPGQYVLVFNNRFAWLTSKAVNAHIERQ